MQFDKSMIIDLLRQQGNHSQADQAEQELPDQVDHEEHAGMLGKLGLDPQDLISKLGGGGGLGKLLG